MGLRNLPDISFVETNPELIIAEKIKNYEDAYFESTGVSKKLASGDPIRIFLYTEALREIQLRHIIDETAKQNLVKYARNEKLDHIGARVKTPRRPFFAAKTRMLLKFSQARPGISNIPKGTRFSPGTNIYFATEQNYELAAGEQELIASVDCTTAGVAGNDFLPGQINVIVDPLPFLVEASNLDVTQGGADGEDDEDYRERVYNAPEGLSVAGPDSAYEFHTKAYSSLIKDVKVLSPSPGVIDIRIILESGEIPSVSFIDGLKKHFGKNLRPLTDKVEIGAPDIVKYDIDITYFILNEDIENINVIQSKVEKALDEFILWQKEKSGRDINTSELIFKIRAAGAKRVEVRLPSFLSIDDTEVAHADNVTLVYGGLEDD